MIARVIVDVETSLVDKIFDYSCFDDAQVGTKVLVPFGKRSLEGYIIDLKDTTDIPLGKLKPITKILGSEPILTQEMLMLANFMVKKYNLKFVDTLKLFLPAIMRNNKVKEVMIRKLSLSSDYKTKLGLIKKSAKNQQSIVAFLEQNNQENSAVLCSNFGSSSVSKLLELGILQESFVQKSRRPSVAKLQTTKHTLTNLQQSAVSQILSGQNQTFLLHGVTGSGKTEVYMNVIESVLKQGKNAIMLVPEISLTPQVMQNFVAKFGDNVAIIHSGLSAGERYDEWQRIKQNKAKIVIGARSAIFAPIQNIGVIIIDEEHDSSYFSESNPRYFTHDVAKFRANYSNCNLVLGSATPSIEDYYKASNGEYTLIEMPVRVNSKPMPNIKIVDMQSEIRNGNSGMFSYALMSKLSEKIEKGEQSILFLNRRGYNSFVMCRDCGYTAKCEDCDVSLVYHKEDNELKCHYCGRRYHMLSECPECHSKYIRYGAIGTQKVVDEIHNFFPNVKVFRMDNDTTKTKNSHEQILSEFSQTKPSILVGTQMIAKGHDFPLVTLVGIIDADVSLHFSDYRANERTFSLITQVAGRAGRSERQGEVILQTYCPRHYVYRYASEYNYKKFYDREINLRSVTNFPPFAVVVRVLVTSEQENIAVDTTKSLFEKIKSIKQSNSQDFIYLGAMKSPVKRIEKKFRYQILCRLKPKSADDVMNKIFDIVNQEKDLKVNIFVELNPQNLS